jgi:hypothetical protein
MVFTTGSEGDLTLWTCLRWEPASRHVRYQRTSPGSRIAFVDVQCKPLGVNETQVQVSYAYVPLSQSGKDFVAAISLDQHAAMIESWGAKIAAYLQAKTAAPSQDGTAPVPMAAA